LADRRGEQAVEEVIEPVAVRHDQLGRREGSGVLRLRLVVLGTDAGRDDRLDVRPAATDRLDDVREHGRRCDDPQGVRVRARCG